MTRPETGVVRRQLVLTAVIQVVLIRREAPPSVLSDISPARGEIARVTAFANLQN